ncbi:MAG: tsf [Dehalococcoidia bacterium]|nr:tsf [Dehalococcoidia bacterium]
MTISSTDIKELREKSGAGVMDCRNALAETCGDMEKAHSLLKQRGVVKAEKKAVRAASQGLIASYIHHSGKIGAMVELNCETDFVARTDDFKELARNLAMQVAATAPKTLLPEANASDENNDSQASLLLQPFIKDAAKTIQDVVMETSAKVGEAVKVKRFVRFELGE